MRVVYYLTVLLAAALALPAGVGAQSVSAVLELRHQDVEDQDDMTIWVHPENPELSVIIGSDKEANTLFVYDLKGAIVQNLPIDGRPGNIDIRYGFPMNDGRLDIVAYNNRKEQRVDIFRMDAATRTLSRIDDGTLTTGENYGICLYQSPVDGHFSAFVTSQRGVLLQFLLAEADGAITGTQVRQWSLSSVTEGCVCDDETGEVFFAEEARGIWRFGAEPADATTGDLIAEVGDNSGLAADVEGVTIYYAANGEGYLIASSQGANKFTILERKSPHRPVGEFTVTGVTKTDGIDVINVPLGNDFPAGLFAFHNGDASPYPVGVVRWQDIASAVGGVGIDTTYWHPRDKPLGTSVGEAGPPDAFGLAQNFPNPFNPETTIRFQLAAPADIRLEVSNLLGQPVATIASGVFAAGEHSVSWDGRDQKGREVAGGLYFYRLAFAGKVLTRTMVLLK